MVLYSIIMIATAMLFAALSVAIYKGKTDLIHDYHQTKVKDKAAYGKAFGKALSVFSAAMLLSGIVGLFGDSSVIVAIAMAVLFVGIGVGIGCIIVVQRKYNKGIF